MSVAIVTGSAGLVGSSSVRLFADIGYDVIGIDNDLRGTFFGPGATTIQEKVALEQEVSRYTHYDADIRNRDLIDSLLNRYGKCVGAIVHAAAQPSHDWAATDPRTDFEVNALGTHILLEAARKYCPEAAFIFTSTNKVYGDHPNRLPLVEHETRWEIDDTHGFLEGIDESMPVDDCLHSLFGVSKLSADIMVQEYGRYFGMPTACFRAGCLTGSAHAGARLHGFLAYLAYCAVSQAPYTIFGYLGKQVRDNLHAADLALAFAEFAKAPRPGAVYNIGGGRYSNCSVLEAIRVLEDLTGRPLQHAYTPEARMGDHIWWITDTEKFRTDYPAWEPRWTIREIVEDVYDGQVHRRSSQRSVSHDT